jgi:hypothetical protein
MALNKHLPSHVTIAGYRALVSYEGQPQTFYDYGETDHMYQVYPKGRGATPSRTDLSGPTWAQLTAARLSLPDTRECRTNSKVTAASGQRRMQQTHTACTSAVIGESGPAPPQKRQMFRTHRRGKDIMAQRISLTWKPLSSGRTTQ